MGKKSAATAVSKMSSASAPATSTSLASSNKSSILRSSFAPSSLQLHLFASVIQSLDSQQLRIHDTNTGRLRQQHATRPGTVITSLAWGHYGVSQKENGDSGNKKKRKRAQHSAEDVVVAYGNSASEICMYSPAEGRVVNTLSTPHDGGIKDFKFSVDSSLEGWSLGGDGKLIQWDLSRDQIRKSVVLPDSTASIISSPSRHEPRLLCASTTPFSIYTSEDLRIGSFDSFKGQVHSLQRSGKQDTDASESFIAADHGRFINVFDIEQRKIVRTLLTGGDVEQLELSSPASSSGVADEQILAVVTRDDIIELFAHPFKLPAVVNGDLKSKRKNITRKSNAQVKLITTAKKASKIYAVSIQGGDLIVVSVENGVDPAFQKVRWQDEGSGELLFEGTKEVVKVKSASTLNAAQMNGAKDMGRTHVDESKTVVVNGGGDFASQDTAIEISSGDEEEKDEHIESNDGSELATDALGEDVSADSEDEAEAEVLPVAKVETDVSGDAEMEDAEDHELSFGDLLAQKHPTTIAIADSFAPEKSNFDVSKQLALPSGMSLGTVLTQALRTNDTNLLESCLHANDAGIIQNTIQRLDSSLAAVLLSKLAERLASRPGRYGHLLSWVQWTCIAHGGAIAGQPDVTAKIRTLYRVLTQRSKSLDKLLLLKGKLDMLDAQLTLRKQVQAQRGTQVQNQGEPGMIYIEGEEDNWSSDEDVDETAGVAKKLKTTKKQGRRALEDLVAEEATSEDEDGDMPTMNGINAENSDDEEDSDEEAEITRRSKGGLYDIEADVSGEDDDLEDDAEDIDDSEESIGEDDDDEDDSSMDSFINDGEVSSASEEDEIDIDEAVARVFKPETKRSKHR